VLPELSWSGLCAFGAGGLVLGLLGLVAAWRQGLGAGGPGLAPVLVALTGLGLCGWAAGRAPLGWPALALAGLLLLFQAGRSDRLAAALAAVLVRARSPRWQWAALALGCPAAAVLLASRLGPPPLELPPIRPLPRGTARTDRDRDVPLSVLAAAPQPAHVLEAAEAQQLRDHGLSGRVLQVAPPDWSYNCHGWVFTGGPYLMSDHHVEGVLRDNEYSPVERPEVGDLAVYRDERGAVRHTAQVWAVGEDGRVVLESKWAWMGRYLHLPDATPYGGDCIYYHSPRRGHRLRGPEGRSLPAPAAVVYPSAP
jgi:hypothetical protein